MEKFQGDTSNRGVIFFLKKKKNSMVIMNDCAIFFGWKYIFHYICQTNG